MYILGKGNISGSAVLLLLFGAGFISGQSFTPTGDPETDKRNWLLDGNPQISVNAPAPTTILNGVLWPTLLQVQDFFATYNAPTPLIITGASELDHHTDTLGGMTHITGFKVDLRIGNPFNTTDDSVSQFIFSGTSPDGCRIDSPGRHAPQYVTDSNVVFALEYPTVAPPSNPCVPPVLVVGSSSPLQHWDTLSSFSGITVDPQPPSTLTVQVGGSASLSPVAVEHGVPIPNVQPWMFDYNVPDDPNQQIVSVDDQGNVTGVGVGSVQVLVSEGDYYQFVNVDVQDNNPPNGGPQCSSSLTSACWQWSPNAGPGSGGWVWVPSSSNPTPTPNSPPPPGACSSNAVFGGPCWHWNPNANGRAGAWIFVPPPRRSIVIGLSPTIIPVSSLDPNSLSGPLGQGTTGYISGASPAGYTISFGNEPQATAPAQRVVVTDQLDPTRFDLRTLALGPMLFPGPGAAPPGSPLGATAGFSTQVDLRPTTNLLLDITASLDSASGLLTWTLQSLDPNTGQPPTDPSVGFLGPGQGGSVTFTVSPQPSLSTGAVLSDQATIIFDKNSPLSTAVWSNELDNTPPTSQVLSLPSAETAVSFPVIWSGTDVGAGIQSFTIFVSDNGGPFTIWLQNVTATSATFTGQVGHTYGFYSIARDLVGNVEAGKTSAEATTQIEIDTTPPVITPSVSGTLGTNGWYRSAVTVNWSVTDPESGITSSTGCSPITLTTDTPGRTLTCSATNGAGLSNSVSVTIKIDQTPPVISGLPAPGCTLWPPNGKLVQVAKVTASDAGSGMASFNVTGTSSEMDPDIAQDIVITGSGLQPRIVALEAERAGSGNGRVYTITATATDQAGNQAKATATCTVPHNQ